MDASKSSPTGQDSKSSAKSTGPAPGTACDQCHRCKVRCSGRNPVCERCVRNGTACTYSLGKPLGKPKGRKNSVYGPRQSTNRTHSGETVKTVRSRAASCLSSGSDSALDEAHRVATPSMMMGQSYFSVPQPADMYRAAQSDGRTVYSPGAYPLDVSTLDESLVDYFANCQDAPNFQLLQPPEVWDQDFSQTDSGHASSSMWSGQAMSHSLPFDNSSIDSTSGTNMDGTLPLGLIQKLHYQQKSISWRSINSTLCVARQSLDAITSFIAIAPQHAWPASTASSQIISCFLMLQQSLGCYMELWSQSCDRFDQGGVPAQQQAAEIMSIGGFGNLGAIGASTNPESCKSVLENIIRGELGRGQVILTRLRELAAELKSVGDDKTGLLQMLFSDVDMQR